MTVKQRLNAVFEWLATQCPSPPNGDRGAIRENAKIVAEAADEIERLERDNTELYRLLNEQTNRALSHANETFPVHEEYCTQRRGLSADCTCDATRRNER